MTRDYRPDLDNDETIEEEEQVDAHNHHDPADDAENVRSESQTAQDRDHTIRGGDDRTAPMKEFPT